jgi:polyisoprenyl-phosphate glycosyltransferase
MFFFSGVQLFFMGMIGEYVLAIYGQVREKPVVFERERINFVGSAPDQEG